MTGTVDLPPAGQGDGDVLLVRTGASVRRAGRRGLDPEGRSQLEPPDMPGDA